MFMVPKKRTSRVVCQKKHRAAESMWSELFTINVILIEKGWEYYVIESVRIESKCESEEVA